eukprot:3965144-Amphidinium_carterae.1
MIPLGGQPSSCGCFAHVKGGDSSRKEGLTLVHTLDARNTPQQLVRSSLVGSFTHDFSGHCRNEVNLGRTMMHANIVPTSDLRSVHQDPKARMPQEDKSHQRVGCVRVHIYMRVRARERVRVHVHVRVRVSLSEVRMCESFEDKALAIPPEPKNM